MTDKQIRKKITGLMVKHNVDILPLPVEVAFKLGIDSITLVKEGVIRGIDFDENYVKVKKEDVKEIYDAIRKDLNEIHLCELSEEQVEELESEVEMGSLYVSDYENTFGVNPNEVCSYADGYLEAKGDPEEFDEYESFYDYIQGVEWID